MFKLWMFLILLSNIGVYSDETKKPFKLLPQFIINIIKNKADTILEKVLKNDQCAKDLKLAIHESFRFKRWALEMLDSTSKLPSGIMAGNIYMNGNFDECLDINEIKGNSTIRGQYCSVLLTPNAMSDMIDYFSAGSFIDFFDIKASSQVTDVLKTIKVTYGICIPHTCSIGSLQKLWDYLEHTFRVPVHVIFYDTMCSSRVKTTEPYDVDIFIYSFFGIYFLFLLLSTAYDFFSYKQDNGEANCFLIYFSIYRNAKKLFKFNDSPEEANYIGAISGLKVICMMWVLYGHRIMLNVFSGTINLIYLSKWKSQIFTAFILSGSYSVDTFLLLSGFLLSYGIFTYQKLRPQEMTVPVLPLYIYRFLRLSPGLLAVVLFNIAIFKNLNDGPIWPIVAMKTSRTCLKTWFATVFFFNNYINWSHQCIEHSWYLAVDSQLFLISPIILNNLLRRPWKTCLVCIGICIISGMYTFIITIRNSYGAIYFEGNKPYLQHIYQPTMVRMPPWFIGIIFGFMVINYRNVKISLVLKWLAWVTVLITLTGLILVHLVFTSTNEYIAVNAALYNSCARQLWALGIATMLFLCINDRDGIINKFLSMPLFRVTVRLSYSFFLTHGIVLLYFIGGKKHSTYFANISSIHDFFGDLIFVFGIATVWCLAFESPFVAIAKKLYKLEESLLSTNNQLKQKKRRGKKNKNNYMVCVYKFQDDEILSQKKIE